MSSLGRNCSITVNDKNTSPTPTLRKILNPCKDLLPVKFLQIADALKRISLLMLLENSVRASMTVETALVLPLFCFFMIHMGSAIEMIRLHGNLEVALWDAGRQAGMYGEVLATGEDSDDDRLGTVALSYIYIKEQIRKQLGEEYLEQSPLAQGIDSLQFLESSRKNDCYEIVVTYKISPLLPALGFWDFRMANRYYGHIWNGYKIPGTETEQEYVYVTEDSEVYHRNKECTHLKLSVQQVQMTELPRGYTPCEKCVDRENGKPTLGDGIYYICTEGERYHNRRDCPGLKRTVYRIAIADTDGLRECSRCGGTLEGGRTL